MFVDVKPVVGVGGFTPEIEDVVVDSDAKFLVRKIKALGKGVFEFWSVFGDSVGDGAEVLGSGFVVGFEFNDSESLILSVVVESFDGGSDGLGCVVFGVVEDWLERVVDKGGIEGVEFGFLGEGVFPVLSGGFVDAEGAFEVGFFFAEVPVADASGVDAGDGCEGFVGCVGELVVSAGGGEDAVPEVVGVGFGEGGALFEVGVALEVLFE